MSIATLFGKLREHELELGRLKEEEEGEKRQSIALKAAAKTESRSKANKDKETTDQEDEDSDSETLNLMVKRFSRFLKYKINLMQNLQLQEIEDSLPRGKSHHLAL